MPDYKCGESGQLGRIEVTGLTRTYRRAIRKPGVRGALRHMAKPAFEEVTALARIDLSIEPGESVGYVGPNGAGKSTTIKILCGVIGRTSGTAHVNGLDPARGRTQNARKIGVVWGQRPQLWWDLPLRESFTALGAIYGVAPARLRQNQCRLVDALDLGDLLSVPVRQLSLGQRTRANICAALLHDPHVVFLDEPTIGLDLFVRERVRDAIRDLQRENGCTLLLSSHDLSDVEDLCDRLVILDHGRIIHDGPLDSAIKQFATTRVLRVTTRQPLDSTPALMLPGASIEHPWANQLIITFDERTCPAAEVTGQVLATCDVADLSLDAPSIEDVLRQVTRTHVADGSSLRP